MQQPKTQHTTLSRAEADMILRGMLQPVRGSLRSLARMTSDEKNRGLASGASAVMDGLGANFGNQWRGCHACP